MGTTKYVSFFGKLVKDTPEASVAIMMTLLKIATKYHSEGKKMFIGKWNDFFVATFPSCTFTFKQKEGPKVPALGDAVKYLVDNGFAERTEVAGKDYKLFSLRKDAIAKINNALDKDSLTEEQDDELAESIDAYYAENEKSKTSAASKIGFDSLFN